MTERKHGTPEPPPFRSAPWVEIAEPEAWRIVMLRSLRAGPAAGAQFQTAVMGVRWLAKRITPPDVQAAAHTDELVEQQGSSF